MSMPFKRTLPLTALIAFSTLLPLKADFFIVPVVKKNEITVKTSGGDFTSPIDAINSISDAAEDNRYRVLLGPGVFDIGSGQLVMKPYVDIIGSGINATTITGNFSLNTLNACMVHGRDNTALSSMTLLNTASGALSNCVISYLGARSASMDTVSIRQQSGATLSKGLTVNRSDLTLNNVEILFSSGGWSEAFYSNESNITAQGLDVIFTENAALTHSFGILARQSTLLLGDSTVENYATTGQSMGIETIESNLLFDHGTVNTADGFGLYGHDGSSIALTRTGIYATQTAFQKDISTSAAVHASTMDSGIASIYLNHGDDIMVVRDSNISDNESGGHIYCVNSLDTGGLALDTDCD